MSETRNQRDRRELQERDERWERERAEERRRETRERRSFSGQLSEESKRRIDELESELVEAVKGCNTVCEALEIELARVTAENQSLKTKQAELEVALADLRVVLAESGGKVIEHPLRAVN